MGSMNLPEGAYIEDGFVIYGDQGYTLEEWARRGDRPWRSQTPEERQEANRQWMRRRRMDPLYRARERARARERKREKALLAQQLRPLRCPGDLCLTMTPGGRLCHFCIRSLAVAA